MASWEITKQNWHLDEGLMEVYEIYSGKPCVFFKPEDTKSPRVQALFEHILLQDVMLNHHRFSD